MVRRNALLLLAFVLGVILGGGFLPAPAPCLQESATSTRTPQPSFTPTPTGYVGTITLFGTVRDAENRAPLAGAEISLGQYQYIQLPTPVGAIVHTISAPDGRYTLGPVALRDTDALTIRVEAAGYAPQQVRFGGLDIFYRSGQGIDFLLSRGDDPPPTFSPTPTVTTTFTPTSPPDLTRTTATPTVNLTRYSATPSFTPSYTPSRTPTVNLTRMTATPTPNFTKTSPTPTPTATAT